MRYSSGLEADDTSYLPSGSVLSGGEYVGNDLLTSPNQARPVNSSLQKEQKLNPFNWAVTSFQENNTALVVCFRQKEVRARKYLLKYLISIEILNNTKHRESKICSRTHKPKTLLILDSQDPSQNQSNRYLIRVSGLNTTLRAVHILKYSAHAVCFRNETMIESIGRKEERKNEMKVIGRSIHLPIRLNTGLPVDLYIYRGICKNDEDLKIYLRGFQQKYYQRKGTNADLPKPTMKREDRYKLSELVLKEERLTNNLWADQWKHSALAVCFLFYGKEEVVTPQEIKLMMHYNTNHGDELYSCLRELVLYLVKEMQLYHPKLNRSQRRKKLAKLTSFF